MADENERLYRRAYYANNRERICMLARHKRQENRVKIRLRELERRTRKRLEKLNASSPLPPGLPEDIVSQMLTINLEENEEKTSEETL